ncbi:ABC transporter ATP-binding protein [bacterium]|nr:MAG: ABC transporter ATP-binding protein [bacterium]
MVNSDSLIRTSSLQRHYQVGKQLVKALDGVDIEVKKGEFVALVGPSGSGKSTLLSLLGGLDKPTGGQIEVGDISLGGANEKQLVKYRRERVGFIFQSFNLLVTRSAVENVETPLILAEVKPKERRKRALELLEEVGLAARANHKPNELSGGEMQRVAVARSLANKPQLLLADEPTGNLDSQTGQGILDMLRYAVATQGVTLVMVTHDMHVASYADRIVHMLDGKIQRIEGTRANTEENLQ